ncbi:NB-ARC domain-containing protein (plasmid) [Streptomyces anulatus]|uniref:NB-ARC domain-containing protein n=1 Tax=Streptomyces anulatus TaxID=1892 RepID=UPI002F90A7C2|nr:NB-ARC domain-containing protein [Streptomyces anulatus]
MHIRDAANSHVLAPVPETSVSVEKSGDAIASAPHAVAITGHVSNLTLYPPHPRPPVRWPLLSGAVPPLASAFQDRTEVRDQIDQARAGHTTVVLAQVLAGGGGVGKSQLAAAYAHQALADGLELVVWADASETEQVIARYAHAAHCVQLPSVLAGRGAEADARAFLQWLATCQRSWLVVLDDITDPEGMQPWWPPPSFDGRGRVLATTRRQDALLSGGGRAVVDIDTYTAEEADTYLRERLRVAHAEHLLDSHATGLAKALGYLPLALAHAAAYMANEDVSCADYLRRFHHSTARLSELLPPHADTEGYGRQVAAALMLCLDVAQACEPVGLATPTLRLAAMLDPAGHPRSLWASEAATRYLSAHRASSPSTNRSDTVSPAEAQAALRLLHRYGLLTDEAQAGPRAVRLHALTARAVREYTPADELPDIVKTAADALTELWRKGDPGYRDEEAVLRTNVDSLDAYAGDLLWKVEGHHILRWAGRSLTGYGLATASLPYWQRLTANSERLLGRAHPHTLDARRELAVAYFHVNRSTKAFALLQEDFRHHEGVLVQARPNALQKSSSMTTALLEDTLAVRERLLGHEDPATRRCRLQLALAQHASMALEATPGGKGPPQATRKPPSAVRRLQRWWGELTS